MRIRALLAVSAVALLLVVVGSGCSLASVGAGALLHPAKASSAPSVPEGCVDRTFDGAGVRLRGWYCPALGPRRAILVYLHGVADSRASARSLPARFTARGYDVVAYDSRANGQSEGEACTYGFYEKQDLVHVLDALPAAPVALLGTSLGAAVALQHAAIDRRVRVVVAAETFSDLRTVATERAPFVFTKGTINRAITLAERDGHFTMDDVSPVRAAVDIQVPVLLVHGAADTDTPPAHSQRVFAALAGRKRLMLVPGARHNESMRGAWDEAERWIDEAMGP